MEDACWAAVATPLLPVLLLLQALLLLWQPDCGGSGRVSHLGCAQQSGPATAHDTQVQAVCQCLFCCCPATRSLLSFLWWLWQPHTACLEPHARRGVPPPPLVRHTCTAHALPVCATTGATARSPRAALRPITAGSLVLATSASLWGSKWCTLVWWWCW